MNEDIALPTTIDLTFLDRPGVIAAFLLQGQGEAALIETGPSSTLETLLEGVARAGVAPEAVRHVLVTHIHLDHAGASGMLLRRLPNATLYVHERGAAHLADPTRLVASATRIYGTLMDRMWGEVVPVPPERMVTLRDGDRLDVAGHRLEVLYTPGHAVHHVAFHDREHGSIFLGDVGGVRMPGSRYVRPPTPPPDLDLEAWDASIDRLEALRVPVFYLTHFGRFAETEGHLEELRRRLREWEQVVLDGLRAAEDRAAIVLRLQRAADETVLREAGAETVRRYEMASAYDMNVSGYERYLRKRYDLPAAAAPTA